MSNKMTTARKERIAEILVEAFISGNDRKVAEANGISARTLRNHRKRLGTDSELSQMFRDKKARVAEGWEDEVPGAMRESISFIRRAAETGDSQDPEMLHAVAGAMKMVSEVAATWKVLDVKFPKPETKQDARPQQPAATLPN